MSSCFVSRSAVFMFSMTLSLASITVIPSNSPAAEVIRPDSSIPFSSGRPYFMIHSRSSLSPIEHIITTPVPKSGSTLGSDMTFTLRSNTGVTSSLPTRDDFARSSGWTATSRHVQRSSGRVVAIGTSSPVSASLNRM